MADQDENCHDFCHVCSCSVMFCAHCTRYVKSGKFVVCCDTCVPNVKYRDKFRCDNNSSVTFFIQLEKYNEVAVREDKPIA